MTFTARDLTVCPACGRKKATGRSIMVALDDDSEVLVGGRVCTWRGCNAESIGGVVIRASGGLNPRTDPKAAAAVADAIERQAAESRKRAASLLLDAEREAAIAARYRALHPVVPAAPPRLTKPQQRMLDAVRAAGALTFNGRHRATIEALERLGLVVVDWGVRFHAHGRGMRVTDKTTVRPA